MIHHEIPQPSSHYPQESDLKICHLCGKKHSTNSNLKQHMEMVHEKKRKYTCNICDAEFYFNHQYEQHVKGKSKKLFPIHISVGMQGPC